MRLRTWCALWLAACNEQSLGTIDAAPNAAILAPVNGDKFYENAVVRFQGSVNDDGPVDALTVTWRSDRDGVLAEATVENELLTQDGEVAFDIASLSVGVHAITLQVVDGRSQDGSTAVSIEVIEVPDAPEISVVRPISGDLAYEGAAFELQALVSDAQDAPATLSVVVTSDRQGDVCTMGVDQQGLARCSVTLAADPDEAAENDGLTAHRLTFRVSDPSGLSAEDVATLNVVALDYQDNDRDGVTEAQGDCDDANVFISPLAPEVADTMDNDCDSLFDEGTVLYDDDGDGFCEAPTGQVCTDGAARGDCDDGSAATHPDADEVCNDGIDNDCSGQQENEGAVDCRIYFYDFDADSYGDEADTACLCQRDLFYKADRGGDCDDFANAVNPSANEAADRTDNDCDGVFDEGTSLFDDDGDGFCESTAEPCTEQPDGTVADGGDCDDRDADVNPDALEVCGNGVDDNCALAETEENGVGCSTWYRDFDGDGFGVGTASKCLCGAVGDYRSQDRTDCYDGNPNVPATAVAASQAYPGQTDYFDDDRGDGSFDYDCDNRTTPDAGFVVFECSLDAADACSVVTPGWQDFPAGCGQERVWYAECEVGTALSGDPICEGAGGSLRVQACR